MCDGLIGLVPGAEVIVTECSCKDVPVHLNPDGLDELRTHASPGAKFVVTHLDGHAHPRNYENLIVAQDLAKFSF